MCFSWGDGYCRGSVLSLPEIPFLNSILNSIEEHNSCWRFITVTSTGPGPELINLVDLGIDPLLSTSGKDPCFFCECQINYFSMGGVGGTEGNRPL